MNINWKIYQKPDRKWYWHCRDGGPRESAQGFDTMVECLADAEAHGYATGCGEVADEQTEASPSR